MQSCEAYQAQTLEYLYDLLEDSDRQAFEAHLAVCAPCQAALDRARGHQRLLATAAKLEFPAVRFQPPALPPPVVVPLEHRRRPWRRWAVAAAVLVALAGLGLPAAYYGHDYAA